MVITLRFEAPSQARAKEIYYKYNGAKEYMSHTFKN